MEPRQIARGVTSHRVYPPRPVPSAVPGGTLALVNDYYRQAPELYDETTRGIPGDVEFYRDLALASGGPVVELGVGTGRIAIPTAAAGVAVTGIDTSPEMLAVARDRAEAAGVASRLRLVHGDMRTFTVERPVPLVTIPFRSFLHNLQDADQQATLAACFRALQPGGRLALNVFNPDLGIIARWAGRSARHVEPFDAAGRVEAHHEFQPAARTVTSHLRWQEGGARRRGTLTLRYVGREEMEALLGRAGFTVEALYGDCRRGAFTETSTELVWLAKR
jgi:ubiquinone/menaquinone biosynthesis C-methylase UbiE